MTRRKSSRQRDAAKRPPTGDFERDPSSGSDPTLRRSWIATASLGTELLLAHELATLGLSGVHADRGSVAFEGTLDDALSACVESRIAVRILWPLGTFAAPGKEGPYEAAVALPWERFLDPSSTFAIDATLRDSIHTHSGFVGLRVKDAIVDRLRDRLGKRPSVDTKNPAVRVMARLRRDRLELSLDLCGEPLHRRGYRRALGGAPLKENLAAAVLLACGYEGQVPLLDPMCGSGTLLLEAALIATRTAPGLNRHFAVERWPHHGVAAKPTLDALKSAARARMRSSPHPIWGADKSDEVLELARANLKGAGLGGQVQLQEADLLDDLELPPGPPGLIVSNPPWGARLGGSQKGMKSFYYALGERLGTLDDWEVALLAGNPAFESAFHRRPDRRLALRHGPIDCVLLQYLARSG